MRAGRSTGAPTVEVSRARAVDPGAVSALLTTGELSRISGFRTAASRARVATARALLRCVVADCTAQRPQDVVFTYRCAMCGGPHGKPLIAVPHGCAPVHASVSYSGALVLVATADVPVGADVERCTATAFAGFDEVALCAVERDALADLPTAHRAAQRAQLWVRKEAVLKIDGMGLSMSPSELDVRDATRTLRVPAPAAKARRVRVQDVSVPTAYQAAVAVAGRVPATVTVRDAHALLAAAVARVGTATV